MEASRSQQEQQPRAEVLSGVDSVRPACLSPAICPAVLGVRPSPASRRLPARDRGEAQHGGGGGWRAGEPRQAFLARGARHSTADRWCPGPVLTQREAPRPNTAAFARCGRPVAPDGRSAKPRFLPIAPATCYLDRVFAGSRKDEPRDPVPQGAGSRPQWFQGLAKVVLVCFPPIF